MARLGHALAFLILLCWTLFFTSVTGRRDIHHKFKHLQAEAAQRHTKVIEARRPKGFVSQATATVKNITFSNPKASGA
jgi:hypothetical protein